MARLASKHPTASSCGCIRLNTNAAAIAARAPEDNAPRVQRVRSRVAEGWWAREYLDDGIFHVEIRDATGCTQVIIANAAGLYWALPIGFPAARVSFPSWRLKLPDDALPSDIYECVDFVLVRYSNTREVLWFIDPGR